MSGSGSGSGTGSGLDQNSVTAWIPEPDPAKFMDPDLKNFLKNIDLYIAGIVWDPGGIFILFVVRIQRGDGGVQEYLLHCVGCGRAGQDQVKNIRNFHTEGGILTLMQISNHSLASHTRMFYLP